ncbi:hypothetical protein ACFSR9_08870 [Deinococcus taklimakanensis]|uniref:Transposase n=1 Tax=Deinococcus taklimakanensis TaxID=536443 RepID=A0ABW5P343_9DEIO
MPKPSTPRQKRGTRHAYTPTEIEHALAVARATTHPEGGINWTRASRQLGIAVNTLKKWEADPGSYGVNDDSVTTIKTALHESYLEKAKRAREVLLDRMISVAKSERDLFKLSGAFKTVADAASQEEVNNAVASRIRGHSAVSQPAPAPGADAAGSAGGANPTIN